jgi:hypothetical protein
VPLAAGRLGLPDVAAAGDPNRSGTTGPRASRIIETLGRGVAFRVADAGLVFPV